MLLATSRILRSRLRPRQLTKRCAATSSNTTPFKASDLIVEKTNAKKQKIPFEKLQFGKYFTDHWVHVEWHQATGWAKPHITPYGKIELEPSALVFHYALECFEGLKAYKDKNGRIRLFRPMENMNRMSTSAARLCLPTFPKEEWLECIKQLLRLDADWIPDKHGYSLYLRPTMIATEAMVGVHAPGSALLFCILSPVGPYYQTGFKPVALLADAEHVRAWPGGTGGYKIGANYAPGILPALEANKKGYQQILWLNGDNITEVGTMNLFCFWKNKQGEKELITADLDGTILPGVTRKSILELTREWKEFKVTERTWTMQELLEALNQNRVIEMFGSGTAAVVSPIYKFNYKGVDYNVPCKDGVAGDLARRLLQTIQAIQYGEVEHPWSVIV